MAMVCEFVTKIGNNIKRQKEGVVHGLIDLRLSREPFFGVQSVFAPGIDKLIKERGTGVGDQKSEEEPSVYHIKTLFHEPPKS